MKNVVEWFYWYKTNVNDFVRWFYIVQWSFKILAPDLIYEFLDFLDIILKLKA